VVVLGSGYSPRDDIPVSAAISDEGLPRIVEGVRIFRAVHAAHLVVSGGAPAGKVPSAIGYAKLAEELGVERTALNVLDRPLDTSEEALAIAKLVEDKPFILVTSAYHMPRAVSLMRRAGLHPIPAPTGQLAGGPVPGDWAKFMPTFGGLRKSERAIHEYLGLAALAWSIH